ncbi:MAG: NAD(P)H-dependent glycerol-3-phosphate dehydrogenase [Pseudomonadota bacterium]
MKIAVLGAGAWGSALAVHFTARHDVVLWARSEAQAQAMAAERRNARYLPDIDFPASLDISHRLDDALAHAELLLVAVPSSALRSLLEQLAALDAACPLIWVCKGFEKGSGRLPHEIVAETLPDIPSGVLSGPSFAIEVAKGLPTAVALASHHKRITDDIAHRLHGGTLRIYTSEDVVGIELGGAVKNVIAIAAGISDGLGFGHNARAALITRSLAEITRLGLALGGHMETFMGLSGMGDLILTCTGDLSRNRQVGLRLAKGEKLGAIIESLGHVAEGISTTPEVLRLATRLGVDMPITRAVNSVLYENLSPRQAVEDLLHRNQKAEDPRQ